MLNVANEALGQRKKRRKWERELNDFVEEKKQEYLNYIQRRMNGDRIQYKRLSVTLKKKTRKLNRTHWDNYINNPKK